MPATSIVETVAATQRSGTRRLGSRMDVTARIEERI